VIIIGFLPSSVQAVHPCLQGEAPRYPADLITLSAAATARVGLRSATCGSVAVPCTTVVAAVVRWCCGRMALQCRSTQRRMSLNNVQRMLSAARMQSVPPSDRDWPTALRRRSR